MRALLAALVLAFASQGFADVVLNPAAPVEYRRLSFSVQHEDPSEGVVVTYETEWSAKLDVEMIGSGLAGYVWGPPGLHWINCRVNFVDPDQQLTFEKYRHAFTIRTADDPDPDPDPEPEPTTLCELVTPLQAVQLAKIYAGQAAVFSRDDSLTGDLVLRVHARQLDLNDLAGHGASEEVDLRIRAALPASLSETLTINQRHTLTHELSKLADEFAACSPDPDPEPESGPRQIVLVWESASPGQGTVQLINALRSTALDTELRESGHALTLTDPTEPDAIYEKVREAVGDAPLPLFVIMDRETDEVLGVGPATDVESFRTLLEAHGG